jgi:hypothetical protein
VPALQAGDLLIRDLGFFVVTAFRNITDAKAVIAAAKLPTLTGVKIPSQIGEGGLWPFREFVKG